MLYTKIAKPYFFRMDAEKAHHMVIDGLHTASRVPGIPAMMRGMYGVSESKELAMDLFGLHFSHPVGLAAGLDKNAKAVDMFANIGFGFAEVGTVTPKGQVGNDLPRLFRLPSDEALVNRMGFNNEGAAAMAERLSRDTQRRIPIAVNIGKNKTTPNELAHEDYRACLQQLYTYGDFFVVNISSPNTPDLRALQHGDELKLLLTTVMDEMGVQAAKSGAARKPVLVKIAPDMTEEQLAYTVETIVASGVNGIIATNTTISREGLRHENAKETGGLSGKPLRDRSTEVVREVYRLTNGQLPIIGSGGIFTAADAYDKIRAGASLVEIYTALIYKGPELLRELTEGLKALLRKDGFASIAEAIGADHRS
ncbi:quinone-dependent dihydroorotate dehydrogenase [Paenibacillus rhizovicinus]|uniref:Dihydroorotate dehydrogenase (quinone) n=1 Tax=Paenibacillus rhizovicinus TaxID=2704463 RepID=A0A6C0P9D8_9BACL|nr:quinone-dependent dihydroorotate dehydrogenase [Paenibacillus rhizovicinus]QHW34243.1 quinone-dependent dihydroorotate dehydrogenase [Paenibacillus rhizovicinus]